MSQFIWIAVALACLALGGVTWRYRRWMHARRDALSRGSTIVSTASGPIEYSLDATGEGPVLLVSHGTPGGYDQGVALGELVRGAGLRVLATSRPGYLGTPISVGREVDEQADAFAALLDALAIRAAIVLGVSGGAPAALAFARRHPDRCRALVLVSGVARPMRSNTAVLDWLLSSNFGAWVLSRSIGLTVRALEPVRDHRRAIHRLLRESSALRAFAESAAPATPRLAGWRNDDRICAGLDPEMAGEITCSSIVFHGTRDSVVPFDHAEWLVGKIPSARLVAIDGAGHLAFAARCDLLVAVLSELRGAGDQ